MSHDPKKSIGKLVDQFEPPPRVGASACLTGEELLNAAKGTTVSYPHVAACPDCAELCQKLREQLETEGGLAAFLTAARAEASRYEQRRGSRWFSRIWAYFAVTRSGRLATAAMALSAFLLVTAVIWDRVFAPHATPRFTSVFEPEVYTRAVGQLNALVGDMRANRIAATEVKRRVAAIRPILDEAWDQHLNDDQRAEIINLSYAFETAKKKYSVAIERASKAHAADSVSALLQSLSEPERPRTWTVVSLSVKENKVNVEKIVLKTDENAHSASLSFEQDPATATLKTYSANEGANIEWQHVASFAPKQQPVVFKSGLR